MVVVDGLKGGRGLWLLLVGRKVLDGWLLLMMDGCCC